MLARVVALAEPEPNWTALDIGTGTGHTAFAIAPHVRSVVGVDVTPEMLAKASDLMVQKGLTNVRFAVADAGRLPFAGGAFDLVTCRRAAHHFRDITRALAEMRRVLRPGGRLVIDDRSVPEDDFVDETMNALDRLHDGSHVRQYAPNEWRGMLEAAGFAVGIVEPYTRHRPVSSLTTGAAPEDVRLIDELLAGLDAAQRAALNLRKVNGDPHITHWYVMITGRRL